MEEGSTNHRIHKKIASSAIIYTYIQIRTYNIKLYKRAKTNTTYD